MFQIVDGSASAKDLRLSWMGVGLWNHSPSENAFMRPGFQNNQGDVQYKVPAQPSILSSGKLYAYLPLILGYTSIQPDE